MSEMITLHCINGEVAEIDLKGIETIIPTQMWVNKRTSLQCNSVVNILNGPQYRVTETIKDIWQKMKETGYDTSLFYIKHGWKIENPDVFKFLDNMVFVEPDSLEYDGHTSIIGDEGSRTDLSIIGDEGSRTDFGNSY